MLVIGVFLLSPQYCHNLAIFTRVAETTALCGKRWINSKQFVEKQQLYLTLLGEPSVPEKTEQADLGLYSRIICEYILRLFLPDFVNLKVT